MKKRKPGSIAQYRDHRASESNDLVFEVLLEVGLATERVFVHEASFQDLIPKLDRIVRIYNSLNGAKVKQVSLLGDLL